MNQLFRSFNMITIIELCFIENSYSFYLLNRCETHPGYLLASFSTENIQPVI